jgi:hypothetical protein
MANFDFTALVNQRTSHLFNRTDWEEWRYCYEGGRPFRERYLERFSDRELEADYQRRLSLTPIPAYARKEINKVKNSLSQRFPDIIREGGSKAWRQAITGEGRGIDLRGSSMNSFLTKQVIADLLVIGQVGALVDAPPVNGRTAADVPEGFRPYLKAYPMELVGDPVPAAPDSPSDWSFVMLEDTIDRPNIQTGGTDTVTTFTVYYLDEERGNKVTVQKLDESGKEIAEPAFWDKDSIPFVTFNIFDSLMRDACSYQITLLNMISADSNFSIDANFPILTRQRGNSNAGPHLIGADKEVEAGIRKGMFYDKNQDRPGFISPPTEPMAMSLEFRRELKTEVQELVTGVIANLGDDGTLDTGLSFIGACVNDGENRLWDHWTWFENADPSKRKVPVVSYPQQWALKTDEERLKSASDLLDVMNKLPGQEGKKETAKAVYEAMFRGKTSPDNLAKMLKAVDAAPYTTSDPDIVKMAAEQGLAGKKTLSMSLGYNEDEAEIAKEEAAEKAKMIVAAQSDAANGSQQGNDEATVDPRSNKVGREGEADKSADLELNEDKKGVRGDGK